MSGAVNDQSEPTVTFDGTNFLVAFTDHRNGGGDIYATRVATARLNARARPWIWGRPPPKPRTYRRKFVYAL